jgi:acyl-CoA thioester hydrolase
MIWYYSTPGEVNDSLISLIHEARVQFFKSYGFTESDVNGVGILITSLAVNYKAEGFYRDSIQIEIGIDTVSKARVDILYSLTLQHSRLGIATAMTAVTFYYYKKSKVARVPGSFMEVIKDFT